MATVNIMVSNTNQKLTFFVSYSFTTNCQNFFHYTKTKMGNICVKCIANSPIQAQFLNTIRGIKLST